MRKHKFIPSLFPEILPIYNTENETVFTLSIDSQKTANYPKCARERKRQLNKSLTLLLGYQVLEHTMFITNRKGGNQKTMRLLPPNIHTH